MWIHQSVSQLVSQSVSQVAGQVAAYFLASNLMLDEICPLVGYYAASIGNFFFLDFLTLEDGTDMLPRNVGKELPLNAA